MVSSQVLKDILLYIFGEDLTGLILHVIILTILNYVLIVADWTRLFCSKFSGVAWEIIVYYIQFLVTAVRCKTLVKYELLVHFEYLYL